MLLCAGLFTKEACGALQRVGGVGAHALSMQRVALSASGENWRIPSDLGGTLAILASERVTNAPEYGAPAEDGRLHVWIEVMRIGTEVQLWPGDSENAVLEGFGPARPA